MNRIISPVIMRKVYLISRSHHANNVNITLDVKEFTKRYGGKKMISKLEHACYRCTHYRDYDSDYCQYWGEDTISDPGINKYTGCHQFKGNTLDQEIYSLIEDIGKVIGKGAFIDIINERVPETQKTCGDLCKGSPGQCENCLSRN